MHSLFGGRKSSTNLAAARSSQLDEFGALSDSPASPRTQRDKDRTRKRAISSSAGAGVSSADLNAPQDTVLGGYSHLPDGAFFPTIIPAKKSTSLTEYGYISAETDIILSLEDALRLVAVVDRELSTRGALTDSFYVLTNSSSYACGSA